MSDSKAAHAPDPAPALDRRAILWPRIILIRHAHAKEGEKDPERGMHLSTLGRRQAEALAQRAANWQLEAIVCSDMYRACETAEAIRAHHPHVPLLVEPAFREVSASKLAAYERQDPAQAGLGARLEDAWQRILAMPYSLAAVVTHNGLIKYLLGKAIKYEWQLKPPFHSVHTGISAIQVKSGGRANLRFFNDTRHLTPDLVLPDTKTWVEDRSTGRWCFCVDDEQPSG